MHKSRRHYKSVVTIVIVCATLLVLPGIASADIMFDTTAGGDWLLDDDSVENRKFDSFEIVGSNEIPSYWDVTEEIPPSGEWHDDCSSTSGWIYASSWDGWRPWTFASGTLASDNGYLHMQTINGWATGPMWYKELNDVFTLSDFVSFEVDMEMIQPTSYYKGCYMTILYDEVKQPVMYLYGAEWTDAAKDIDLYASFFPAAGGSAQTRGCLAG